MCECVCLCVCVCTSCTYSTTRMLVWALICNELNVGQSLFTTSRVNEVEAELSAARRRRVREREFLRMMFTDVFLAEMQFLDDYWVP